MPSNARENKSKMVWFFYSQDKSISVPYSLKSQQWLTGKCEIQAVTFSVTQILAKNFLPQGIYVYWSYWSFWRPGYFLGLGQRVVWISLSRGSSSILIHLLSCHLFSFHLSNFYYLLSFSPLKPFGKSWLLEVCFCSFSQDHNQHVSNWNEITSMRLHLRKQLISLNLAWIWKWAEGGWASEIIPLQCNTWSIPDHHKYIFRNQVILEFALIPLKT